MMYALLAAATIPTPSPAQLRYMATDFIALIHFNMATFSRCASDPSEFNPTKLDRNSGRRVSWRWASGRLCWL